MRYFPAFFDIKGKSVLIVGHGALAARKARLLIEAQPVLCFLAPLFDSALEEEFAGRARFIKAAFDPDQLDPPPTLLIAASGNADLDQQITAAARARMIPVNAVDQPAISDFVVPSIVSRGDIAIGISTGGTAPVLGRELRAKIEHLLPGNLSKLAEFTKQWRQRVIAKLPAQNRKAFWEQFFTSPLPGKILATTATDPALEQEMATLLNGEPPAGYVHIIGAGPGDPELLTLKALRLLQEADHILYDNLVSEEILALARRDATRIYVGKKKANHTMSQEDIGQLMINLARSGRKVVRLKGGDPFIFGRGGEELRTLRAANITTYLVPGITAATGCAAAASLPLTHRNISQAVTFVTGHAQKNEAPSINWQAIAQLRHTLVVYMGVGRAQKIADALLTAGRGPQTPVAIIENGTTSQQTILKTTLGNMAGDIIRTQIKGPAILVIGEVARLADGDGLKTLTQSALSEERLAS